MGVTRAGTREDYVPRTKKKNEDVLETVLDGFEKSWSYTSGAWHSRWEKAYSLYHNTRTKRGYEGITDTFVPMTFSTIETQTAALFGGKPKFNFMPPSEKADQNTDILNSLLDYYWDKDKWNIKVINWGRSMLMLGTSVVYIYWDIDHPCMVNVPIRDFFIDPTASSLETARFMGRRYLTSLDELKSFEVVDPDTGETKPRYQKLDQVSASNQSSDQLDKQKKDVFYGSTIDEDRNQVEIIEYWTKEKCISVANRSVVIEDTDNWFKTSAAHGGEQYPQGIYPFAVMRDYIDESLFYATGEVDYMADEQELLNDITNQNIDSITFTLNQMYTLDPKYAHLIKEIENIPGATYLAEANALQPIPQRPIPPDAFNERINLKNEIRETTASNEVVKGTNSDKDPTATEINAQIAGAGQRLALKVTQIENEAFHQLARIVFEMTRRYVTEPMMVRVMGPKGTTYETYDPAMFNGEYEPRVQLESTINNQKQQQTNNIKELYASFVGDPGIDQTELKRMILVKAFDLDPDEVELLLTPVPEMPMDMPMDMPMEPMMDVAEDPLTGELMPMGEELLPEEVMI